VSRRSLVLTAVLLAVLSAILVWQKRQTRSTAPQASVRQVKPLPEEFDINAVTGIVLESSSATTHLYRTDSRWSVAEMYGFDADFDRLSQFLRTLAFVESAQVVHGGDEHPEDFGLIAVSNKPWSRVTLRGTNQMPLSVMIGDPWFPSRTETSFMSPGGGRYLRVNDGPVLLVTANIYPLPADPKTWIRKRLLNVDPQAVQSVQVINTNAGYTLIIRGADEYELDGLKEDEELDRGAVNRLRRSMQFLRCIAVADPATPDKELGFTTNSPRFRLTTTNGVSYTAILGGKEPGGGYYLRLTFAFQPPPEPTEEEVRSALETEAGSASGSNTTARVDTNLETRIRQELARRRRAYEEMAAEARREVERLRSELGRWTFVIPYYDYETFTLPREKLVRPKEKKGKKKGA